MTWLIYHFRAIEKILPALKTKGKYSWAPAFLLCLIVLLTSIGIGVYVDGYGIHPPAQFTGICPAPAQIKGGSCVIITVQQVTISGTVTTATYTQQAGYILTTTSTNSTKGR